MSTPCGHSKRGPQPDRSARFSRYLAATLYGLILDKIEEYDINVPIQRASLNATEKWMLTMRAVSRHRQRIYKYP
jgi:hypothetical protein